MKFRGAFENLKDIVGSSGVQGEWVGQDPQRRHFKTADGAILNRWPKTGTISFQGPEVEKRILSDAIAAAISGPKPAAVAAAAAAPKPEIFVVHGHDLVARDQLELVLRRLDLEPYVLMNTAGGGMTIIESLEKKIGKQGEARFGIVLLTPDDVGYAKRDGEKEAKARPRQNVVLEMGMLLSSLTRANVAILVKGFVESPSDAAGIIYLHFNDHVNEVVPKLAERLQLSGIQLTPEQISRASS
ncbi:MAG: nucleotide-binding protein [Candidatus Acidiferrales bacterium]